MRILQISPYFQPSTGGSEWYCQQLSKRLAKRGHEVHVLTSLLDKTLSPEEEMDGYSVHRLPCFANVWDCNPATFLLHRLAKIKADVMHAHSYIFFTSNQVALAKRYTKIPFVLHLHGGIDFTSKINDLTTRFRFNVKDKIYDPTFGKWTARSADLVASVSKRDLELAKKMWGLNKGLSWVPNAVDLSDFPKQSSNEGNDLLNIVFIGRLEPWKGINTFIEAAQLVGKKYNDVRFTVIGDGSLSSYAHNNSIKKYVDFIGKVNHSRIPELLSKASMLVLPSYMEGLPTVCLEALAAQVPVIASNVGGIPEIVIDGETGFLFPPGDSSCCADRIIRILSDDGLRKKLGSNGRQLVEKYFTWDNVVERTERVYESVLA
ncbi:MAG: glycosyltransferase family 4 protein [Candidatus Methanomethylicaceae archaeon]|jgi:glycosyltransferase involved in cell wall biosynthesis